MAMDRNGRVFCRSGGCGPRFSGSGWVWLKLLQEWAKLQFLQECVGEGRVSADVGGHGYSFCKSRGVRLASTLLFTSTLSAFGTAVNWKKE